MANIRTYKDIFAPGFWRTWNDIYHKRVGTVSCSGGRGCISGNTEILTPNGPVKVKEFNGGDVFAMTESGITAVPACCPIQYAKVPMFRVTLADGTAIEVTDEHRFLTATRGWRMLKDLEEGDAICCGDTYFLKETTTDPRIAVRRVLALFYCYWHDDLHCGGEIPSDDETYLDVLVNLTQFTDTKWNAVVATCAGALMEIIERQCHGPEFNYAVAGLFTGKVSDEEFSDALAFCSKNLRHNTIQSVKYIGDKWYYDLFVPFYNNYITDGGIVNHNSTKSSAG